MCNQCNDPNIDHVHAVWTRREALITGAALVAALQATSTGVLIGRPAHAQMGKVRGTGTEWLSYGGDKASSKYSPIDQVGGDNFSRLQVAWEDESSRTGFRWRSTRG